MDQDAFTSVVKNRERRTLETLTHKAKEYARGDRLSNFKRASAAMGCSPEKACVAFWMKHVISITDLVNDLETGKVAEGAMWDEKIGDAVNYLILLEAIVTERLKAPK